MSERFCELPIEKQQRIINAGLEVFSKYDYKKASTEEIALQAGISKGLLFYYFKNKKEFFFYLFNYSSKLIKEGVLDNAFYDITDFFDLLDYGYEKKAKLLEMNPHFMNFYLKALNSKDEVIVEEISSKVESQTKNMYRDYFSNIDFSKFKKNINPQDIIQLLLYITDGYIVDLQRNNKEFKMDEFKVNYLKWRDMFKMISYGEES